MLFENVQRLCADRHISIARLERESGLGNATVRGWVKSSPSLETLKKVADYFGVTIDSLINERGESANAEDKDRR